MHLGFYLFICLSVYSRVYKAREWIYFFCIQFVPAWYVMHFYLWILFIFIWYIFFHLSCWCCCCLQCIRNKRYVTDRGTTRIVHSCMIFAATLIPLYICMLMVDDEQQTRELLTSFCLFFFFQFSIPHIFLCQFIGCPFVVDMCVVCGCDWLHRTCLFAYAPGQASTR